MDSQEKIWKEWWSLKSECWSILSHGSVLFIWSSDILSKLRSIIISCSNWLDAPINKAKETFIRYSPESSWSLFRLKDKSDQTQFSRSIHFKEINLQEWLPRLTLISFNDVLFYLSAIPNVDNRVLRNGDHMSIFTVTGVSLINFDSWWNELNIWDKVLMWDNVERLDQWFHLDDWLRLSIIDLLGSSTTLIIISTSSLWLSTSRDSSICSWQIPNNDLTVEASSKENVGVFWMPFDGGDFNWCLEHIVKGDDVVIREVQYKNIRFKRFTWNKSSQLKFHVVNHTHGHKIRSCRMELEARDSLVFTVIVLKIRSWL